MLATLVACSCAASQLAVADCLSFWLVDPVIQPSTGFSSRDPVFVYTSSQLFTLLLFPKEIVGGSEQTAMNNVPNNTSIYKYILPTLYMQSSKTEATYMYDLSRGST